MIKRHGSRVLVQGRITRDRVTMVEQSPEFQRLVKAVELKSLRAARNNEARMQSALVNAPLASIDFFNLARGVKS